MRDEFQDLFAIYAPIAAAVFAAVVLSPTSTIVVRFRRRRGSEPDEPPQPSDRWRWEVVYAVRPGRSSRRC